jgi:hypothetical protein
MQDGLWVHQEVSGDGKVLELVRYLPLENAKEFIKNVKETTEKKFSIKCAGSYKNTYYMWEEFNINLFMNIEREVLVKLVVCMYAHSNNVNIEFLNGGMIRFANDDMLLRFELPSNWKEVLTEWFDLGEDILKFEEERKEE